MGLFLRFSNTMHFVVIRFATLFEVLPTDYFFSNLVSLDFHGPLCKNYYHLSSFDDTLQNKFHFKNDDGKRFVSLSLSNYRWQVLVALVVKHLEEDDEQKVLGDSSCILGFATGKKNPKCHCGLKIICKGVVWNFCTIG